MVTMNPQEEQRNRDARMAAWAESDAAVTALANSTTPRMTAEGKVALEAFRQAGRPRLSGDTAKTGRSPRRQVRLPEELNEALDSYAADHGVNPSEVIREAISRYLADPSAG